MNCTRCNAPTDEDNLCSDCANELHSVSIHTGSAADNVAWNGSDADDWPGDGFYDDDEPTGSCDWCEQSLYEEDEYIVEGEQLCSSCAWHAEQAYNDIEAAEKAEAAGE